MAQILTHLDAGETASFLRQLEEIDTTAYTRRYPQFLSRQILKSFVSVSELVSTYTWREWDSLGKAKIITDYSDDLPSVDVAGKEFSRQIKDIGQSYGYTIKEIKQSALPGMPPLESMRAEAARRSVEFEIDNILAVGNAEFGLNGLLKLDATSIPAADRVTSTTLATKAAGGVAWGTLLAPKASGQEVANDIIGLCSGIVSATKGIWTSFDVVLPIDQYNYAAATRLNAINDTTALEFALKSSFVASIKPWYYCSGAGAGATDRMMAFPANDALVVAGIVPQEWTPQPAQLRNMKYVINSTASCGGVFARYPVAIRYADGL